MSVLNNFMALQPIRRMISRTLQTSAARQGADSREKRAGHLSKKDDVDGEKMGSSIVASQASFEYIDENLMDTVFEGMKFKDIPVLHINCTRNNTKITLSKSDGSIITAKSAGTEGYKNCRKGTTVAAQAVANRVLTYAGDHNVDTIRLVFNGLGPGRNAAYKVFELSDLKVVSLSDRTEAIEPWIRRPRKAKRI